MITKKNGLYAQIIANLLNSLYFFSIEASLAIKRADIIPHFGEFDSGFFTPNLVFASFAQFEFAWRH